MGNRITIWIIVTIDARTKFQNSLMIKDPETYPRFFSELRSWDMKSNLDRLMGTLVRVLLMVFRLS